MRTATILAGLAFAAAMPAQESAPIGILRGDLVTWAGTARNGQITFHASGDRLYQCSYDDKTYFERDNQRISIAAAQRGDPMEILSDRRIGSEACYARTVEFVEIRPVRIVPGVRPGLRSNRAAADRWAPRGELTLTGVVLRLHPDRLVLRTRAGEHKTILLRPDTRYSSEGQSLDVSALNVSTRVFIRAGKNLEGDLEAYQVMWGDILEP